MTHDLIISRTKKIFEKKTNTSFVLIGQWLIEDFKKEEIDFADELYLSFDETKTLVDNGMYVGNHGYRHLWLDKETVESQSSEIDSSLKFLKDLGSRTEDWIMCYPRGAYNSDTLEILKDRKCVVGLTTDFGLAKISQDSGLELPRYDTNDFPQ